MRSLDRRLRGLETAMGTNAGIDGLPPDERLMVRLHDAWWIRSVEEGEDLEAALDEADAFPDNRCLAELAANIRRGRGLSGWGFPEHVKTAMRNSGRILEHEAALEAYGLLK